MNSKNQWIELGFTQHPFPSGMHMCLLYTDEAERRRTIGEYLKCGILAKEKVSYFTDVMKPEEVRDWLLSLGVALPEDDGFSISVAAKTYCPDGVFVPEQMLNALKALYENAKKAGYPNVRVSGEMSWALKGIPGSERLIEYEALVNEVFITHPINAICQYDVNKFSGATILNVLKVHPMMSVAAR